MNSITDNDIEDFFKVRKHITYNFLPPEYKVYVDTRFNNSIGKESLYRIIRHIYDVPKCPICGNNCKFSPQGKKHTYLNTCGNIKCINKLNGLSVIKTMNERYGVNGYGLYKDFKDKYMKTCQERYGVDSVTQTKFMKEKSKETCLRKFGTEFASASKQFKDKLKQSNLKKYGVEYNFQIPEVKCKIKETCLLRYGVTNIMKLNSVKNHFKEIAPITNKKRRETGLKNHSFGPKSKTEDKCYELLKEIYPNIIRQYTSEEYPYMCDFYVPSIKLYIEYQGYYTHGKHPFDPNNINDIKERERLIDKYGDNHPSVTTWTIKDVEKRNKAKKNNLNYKEFFTLSEVNEFIKVGYQTLVDKGWPTEAKTKDDCKKMAIAFAEEIA